jgi:hypothetical protein
MGHLLKIKCVYSRVNGQILALTIVSFTLTTVQVPNLAPAYRKRITVQHEGSTLLLMVSTKKGRLFRIGEPLEEFFLIDDSVSGGFKMFSNFTKKARHVTENDTPEHTVSMRSEVPLMLSQRRMTIPLPGGYARNDISSYFSLLSLTWQYLILAF